MMVIFAQVAWIRGLRHTQIFAIFKENSEPSGHGTHHDDGILHERLSTHQLVVARIVYHVEDTRFTRAH